jgi:acetate kinase
MRQPGAILALNTGSSSIKFAIFHTTPDLHPTVRGEIEKLHDAPHLSARDTSGALLAERFWPSAKRPEFAELLSALLEFAYDHLGTVRLCAVGHRVVHGGADHAAPEIVTPALLDALDALAPLDPLHMPDNVAPMRAVAAARPDLRQIACFDTEFHRTMPPVATRLALPRAVTNDGIHRYGFHGLSYEYIAGRMAKEDGRLAKGRVIVAHLGSGASLCALQDGRSMETTTGFSALDGLVMATRCGTLDPGAILYLGRQGNSFSQIEEMLYRQSGLLGVSGISGDVRALLASDAPEAHEAIELFTYRIAACAAAMASALQGLDGFVFTAGIGEHAPAIRTAVCKRLAWLGLDIDEAANQAGATCISTPHSLVEIRVIPTDEEAVIARHALGLM